MKFHKLMYVFLFLIQACTVPSKKHFFEIENDLFKNTINSKSGIIISCFNCSCVPDFFDFYYSTESEPIVYFDTACISFRPKKGQYIHLPQAKLDQIYERNYNAILFKKKYFQDEFEFRLLKTEEHKKYMKICRQFFGGKD